MGELAIRHDVFCFGEGRHPAAILEPRIPTHVVDVQMGAHDIVNVINRKPGGSETFLEPITAHHVPERPRRPRLVIANTGINEDIVVQRLYDEALHASHQPPADGIDEGRLQPPAVFLKKFFSERWKEFHCIEKWPLLFNHWINGNVLKPYSRLHSGAFFCMI